MNVDTFGDPIKFPSLIAVTDRIKLLPKSQQGYFSRFISRFNNMCSYLDKCEPSYNKEYLLHLLKTEQTSVLEAKGTDSILISHLRCYVHTKIKILLKSNKEKIK